MEICFFVGGRSKVVSPKLDGLEGKREFTWETTSGSRWKGLLIDCDNGTSSPMGKGSVNPALTPS